MFYVIVLNASCYNMNNNQNEKLTISDSIPSQVKIKSPFIKLTTINTRNASTIPFHLCKTFSRTLWTMMCYTSELGLQNNFNLKSATTSCIVEYMMLCEYFFCTLWNRLHSRLEMCFSLFSWQREVCCWSEKVWLGPCESNGIQLAYVIRTPMHCTVGRKNLMIEG